MRRRDERGAIALVTAAAMVVVLGIAALVIDIGMQRVARQDLQALADVVALDLARMLDGRTARDIEDGDPGPSLAQATDASQARNDGDTVGNVDELDVIATLLVPDDDGEGWRPAGDDDVPEAVRVETSTTVDFGFAGAVGFSSGGAGRSAIAASRSSACFHLGSYAAAIERDGALVGPLNDVFDLDLDPDQYLALAGAELSLDDLADQPSIGSVSRLLDGPLTIGELVAAVRAVLRAQPGDSAPAVAALDDIDAATDGELQAELREVLAVADDDVDALRIDVNVLDVVGPVLLSAAGTRQLDVDFLPAGLTGALDVVGGVQRACSPGTFSGAAVHLTGAGQVVLRDPVAPDALLGLTAAAAIDVAAAVGGADNALADGVECRTPTSGIDRYQVDVAGGLSTMRLLAGLTVTGDIAEDDLPEGVTAIEFDVAVNLGSDAAIGNVVTPAELEVPRNAVNARPARGVPALTGAGVTGFVGLRELGRQEVLDQVVIEIDPEAENPIVAAGRARRLVRNVRRAVDRLLNAQVEVAVGDAVEQRIAPLARVLGARWRGGDVFSEDRPTCVGISLVG